MALTQSFCDANGPRAVRAMLLADGGAVLALLQDASRAVETEEDRQEREREQQLALASRRRGAAAPRRRCAAPECGKQETFPDEFKKCASCARVFYCSRLPASCSTGAPGTSASAPRRAAPPERATRDGYALVTLSPPS
jgi:hypothetical protein